LTHDFHLGWFAIGAVLFARSLLACAAMRRVPFVAPAPGAEPTSGVPPPGVRAILLAGPDPAWTKACVADLLAQRGPVVEVTLVGATAGLAAAARLRILAERPAAGSTPPHTAAFAAALEEAGDDATWVLLLEQPCRFRPDALASLLEHARFERADALWLVPCATTPALFTPSRLTSLADAMPAMAAANRDRETVHWPGLPLLLRREEARAVLADPAANRTASVDPLLAAQLRARGHRGRYAFAADFVDAGRLTPAQLAESVERLFASVGFRLLPIGLGIAFFALLFAIAIAGAFADEVWGRFACGGLASLAIPAWLAARASGASPWPALLAPFAFPIEALFTLGLALRAARRGTVRWRGVELPIQTFRSADRGAP
jgi:hypothetical protein